MISQVIGDLNPLLLYDIFSSDITVEIFFEKISDYNKCVSSKGEIEHRIVNEMDIKTFTLENDKVLLEKVIDWI